MDLCLKKEERINTVLGELSEYGKIDEQPLKSIKTVGRKFPRRYGLANTHKENIPIRTILSMAGSPDYKVAEKTTERLSVIPESKINCLSKQSLDSLRSISRDHDEVAMSFDATSLYTSVSVKEAIIEAAKKRKFII